MNTMCWQYSLQGSCSVIESALIVSLHHTLCKIEVLPELGYILEEDAY